jgi:mono/diheme cytochrome c family protein
MSNYRVFWKGLVLGAGAASWLIAAAGDVQKGKQVFEAQCLDCHRSDSTESKVGPGLKGVHNGKLPSGKPATPENVLDIINKGTDVMPSFKDVLSQEEKENVTAYVLSL